MIEIPIELGERRYVTHIGHGISALLPELLAPFDGRPKLVVSSHRIWALHGARVEGPLRRLGPLSRALIPDGERHKSRRTLNALHDALLSARLGRDGLVISLGGGVVGDVAGFAAATYMRGVAWIALPTTLVAMIDASIGGKVGINHPRVKNLLGAFHQPGKVVVDPTFLETLPDRELRSGLYEALKYGIIGDRALFRAIHQGPADLRTWGRADVDNLVASACRIKAEVVEKDERENDLRRVLNLGHTLGHALEAVTRYRRFTHGEAVGWGIIGAAWISHGRGLLSEAGFDAIAAAVDHLGRRPRVSDLETAAILAAMRSDKKVRGGRMVLVLPTGLGRYVIRDDVRTAEIRRALRVMAAREARQS